MIFTIEFIIKYFQLSEEQCLNWIKKFNACQVQEYANTSVLADESSAPSGSTEDSSPDISIGCFACQDKSSLSVTTKDIVSSTRLPVCAPGFSLKWSSQIQVHLPI